MGWFKKTKDTERDASPQQRAEPEPAAPRAEPAAPAAAAPVTATAPRQQPAGAEAAEAAARTAMRRAHFILGEIVNLLMRADSHRNRPLSDLQWLVLPAVRTGQYTLAEARASEAGGGGPVGCVLWASVSAEIDQRLTSDPQEFPKLAPDEWKSGDIIWIIEALGEANTVNGMLKQLSAEAFKGKEIRLRARGADGALKVQTLKS